MTTTSINHGLQDVYVCDSSICKIDSTLGNVFFRGHAMTDLLQQNSFFEVVFLLWYGRLPNENELNIFLDQAQSFRKVHDDLTGLINVLPTSMHPCDQLRTALSTLHVYVEQKRLAEEITTWQQEALFLLSQTSSLTAYIFARANNRPLLPAGRHRDPNRDFLFVSRGFEFDDAAGIALAELFDKVRIVYAEHEMNAATFATRVTASTVVDMVACFCSALATLKGSIHGGAVEFVDEHYQKVTDAKAAVTHIDEQLARKAKVMGFGHRVYMKTGDPRYAMMREILRQLSEATGDNRILSVCDSLKNTMYERKGILPNLDLAGAGCFRLFGFSAPHFVSLITMSRMAGWAVHVAEQRAAGRIIRPRARYCGAVGTNSQKVSVER